MTKEKALEYIKRFTNGEQIQLIFPVDPKMNIESKKNTLLHVTVIRIEKGEIFFHTSICRCKYKFVKEP